MLQLICLFCLEHPLWPSCPQGSHTGASCLPRSTRGSHRGAPWDFQAAPQEPQRWPMGPPGSPKVSTNSSKWYLWESESGCLILGVQFWHSGVRIWVSDSGSPITTVNLGVRSWVSDPGDSISGVQIEKDTLSDLFGVSRWGHLNR